MNNYQKEHLAVVIDWLVNVCEEKECYLEAKEKGEDVSNYIYTNIKVLEDYLSSCNSKGNNIEKYFANGSVGSP